MGRVSLRVIDSTTHQERTISAPFDEDSNGADISADERRDALAAIAGRIAALYPNGVQVVEGADIVINEEHDWWGNATAHEPWAGLNRLPGVRLMAPSPAPGGTDAGASPTVVDGGTEPPMVPIPSGQDEFGRPRSPNHLRTSYIVAFGTRGQDGNPLPADDPARANIFSVLMRPVATQGDYIRLEGDNGQQFRFRRPANPGARDAELNFEVLNANGQWVAANATTALPTGWRTVGGAQVVAVGDLRRIPAAGVDAARPNQAQREAARILIDGLISDHTTRGEGDPLPDPVTDAAGIYEELNHWPETITVTYSYNGASQPNVTIPRAGIEALLQERGISRPASPAAPPPLVADRRPPRGPAGHGNGGTRAAGPRPSAPRVIIRD